MRFIYAFFFILIFSSAALADAIKLARQQNSFISNIAQPIIECAFDKIGKELEIIIVPWKRAQMGTKNQVYDGFFVAAETPQRNKYATRSVGILSNDWLFIQLASAYRAVQSANFWEQSFTANLGTAKIKWLESKAEKGQITGRLITAKSIQAAWGLMLNQRADVLLENRLNFERLQREAPSPHLLKTQIAREVSQGVYFSHAYLDNHPNFLTEFNQAVQKCS